MLKSTVAKLLMFVVVVGGGALFLLTPGQPSQAAGIPDTTETREVMTAMLQAYKVLETPVDMLDFNILSEALSDHPNYRRELDSATWLKLHTQIEGMLGSAASENFGYLTAMKAKRMYQLKGVQLLKAAMAQAKAENRELTQEEWHVAAPGCNPGVMRL